MREFKFATIALAAALFAAPAFAQDPAHHPLIAPQAQGPDQQRASQDAWWIPLGDPVLAALIEQGLQDNLDIEQARARILRSRALLQGAQAAHGPTGSAGLGARSAQASAAEAPGTTRAQRRSDTVQLGLEFSWEVDLFGRLNAQSSAALQRLKASEAQARGVRLAVSAEIAHAYFSMVGAREQLELARTVAENRRRTLAVVQARASGGMAAPIDDARAQSELEAAIADIPVHEAAVRTGNHRLAVLTGRSPSGFDLPVLGTVQPGSIALPVPQADWLAQRPDLQALEAELHARALDVKAVRAEFMPRLSITGVLGFIAGSVTGLGVASSLSWLSAPSLMAPLLDRPRIEARWAAAKADQQEALGAYRHRVLLAVEEAENALVRYDAGQRQFNALLRRSQHAVQAERLSRVRYDAGAADLLELLDAQRSSQQSQAALAQALMQQRQNLVAVFKALAADTGTPNDSKG